MLLPLLEKISGLPPHHLIGSIICQSEKQKSGIFHMRLSGRIKDLLLAPTILSNMANSFKSEKTLNFPIHARWLFSELQNSLIITLSFLKLDSILSYGNTSAMICSGNNTHCLESSRIQIFTVELLCPQLQRFWLLILMQEFPRCCVIFSCRCTVSISRDAVIIM